MADEEQLRILKEGQFAWITWLQRAGGTQPRIDLSEADLREANLFEAFLPCGNLSGTILSGADLSGANLSKANLSKANLGEAHLRRADLFEANLSKATLGEADLREADLSGADLSEADLSEADLSRANLCGADLSGADLCNAFFNETTISNVDLSNCKNVEFIRHGGPSTIDIRTLQRSGPLPLVFLRGVGLPNIMIEYLPSLLGRPIQHYSCFISYASTDEEFARRLYADLQDKDVLCWRAPEDMKIGAKILDTIDEAIRTRQKVLLILSEASATSEWVEIEVKKALAEERRRRTTVLFPVRLDDAVFATNEAWAVLLRDDRNIGDFRAWKDHDAYQKALEQVLRDLRVEAPE